MVQKNRDGNQSALVRNNQRSRLIPVAPISTENLDRLINSRNDADQLIRNSQIAYTASKVGNEYINKKEASKLRREELSKNKTSVTKNVGFGSSNPKQSNRTGKNTKFRDMPEPPKNIENDNRVEVSSPELEGKGKLKKSSSSPAIMQQMVRPEEFYSEPSQNNSRVPSSPSAYDTSDEFNSSSSNTSSYISPDTIRSSSPSSYTTSNYRSPTSDTLSSRSSRSNSPSVSSTSSYRSPDTTRSSSPSVSTTSGYRSPTSDTLSLRSSRSSSPSVSSTSGSRSPTSDILSSRSSRSSSRNQLSTTDFETDNTDSSSEFILTQAIPNSDSILDKEKKVFKPNPNFNKNDDVSYDADDERILPSNTNFNQKRSVEVDKLGIMSPYNQNTSDTSKVKNIQNVVDIKGVESENKPKPKLLNIDKIFNQDTKKTEKQLNTNQNAGNFNKLRNMFSGSSENVNYPKANRIKSQPIRNNANPNVDNNPINFSQSRSMIADKIGIMGPYNQKKKGTSLAYDQAKSRVKDLVNPNLDVSPINKDLAMSKLNSKFALPLSVDTSKKQVEPAWIRYDRQDADNNDLSTSNVFKKTGDYAKSIKKGISKIMKSDLQNELKIKLNLRGDGVKFKPSKLKELGYELGGKSIMNQLPPKDYDMYNALSFIDYQNDNIGRDSKKLKGFRKVPLLASGSSLSNKIFKKADNIKRSITGSTKPTPPVMDKFLHGLLTGRVVYDNSKDQGYKHRSSIKGKDVVNFNVGKK